MTCDAVQYTGGVFWEMPSKRNRVLESHE